MKKAIAIIAVLALIFMSAIPASAKVAPAVVFADFEDGIGAVENVWMGHDQENYERYNELTNPLVGDSSLGMTIYGAPANTSFGYDGFGFANVVFKQAYADGRTGIVCRIKITLPEGTPENTVLIMPIGVASPGGSANITAGYKITDNSGAEIYSGHMTGENDRFLVNESVDGWLFLTLSEVGTAVVDGATTYVSNANNPLDTVQFCMTGLPAGTTLIADQFGFYSGTDYAAVIAALAPASGEPTDAPTDDGNDNQTGDVSMVYLAVAAVGSASAMFLLRKKK